MASWERNIITDVLEILEGLEYNLTSHVYVLVIQI